MVIARRKLLKAIKILLKIKKEAKIKISNNIVAGNLRQFIKLKKEFQGYYYLLKDIFHRVG